MFGLNPWMILGIVLAFLAFGAAGYGKGRSDATANWKIAMAEQERKANDLLNKLKDKIMELERERSAHNLKTEAENAKKNQYIDGLRIANGRLVAAAGGLWDRNGRAVGSGALPGTPGAPASGAGSATGCQLSDTVVGDLLDLARDADRAAVYAQTCHTWAVGIPQ